MKHIIFPYRRQRKAWHPPSIPLHSDSSRSKRDNRSGSFCASTASPSAWARSTIRCQVATLSIISCTSSSWRRTLVSSFQDRMSRRSWIFPPVLPRESFSTPEVFPAISSSYRAQVLIRLFYREELCSSNIIPMLWKEVRLLLSECHRGLQNIWFQKIIRYLFFEKVSKHTIESTRDVFNRPLEELLEATIVHNWSWKHIAFHTLFWWDALKFLPPLSCWFWYPQKSTAID